MALKRGEDLTLAPNLQMQPTRRVSLNGARLIWRR